MLTERGWRQPVSIPILSKALDAVIRPIHEEAIFLARESDKEVEDFLRGTPASDRTTARLVLRDTRYLTEYDALDLVSREAHKRVGRVTAVWRFVTTMSDRYLGGLVALLRHREDFELSDAQVIEIVRAHLPDAAMVADCDLRTPQLRPLKHALDSVGCSFPEARLVPALRKILGQHMAPGGRYYFGPVDDVVLGLAVAP
jgi:hypothetical protein